MDGSLWWVNIQDSNGIVIGTIVARYGGSEAG